MAKEIALTQGKVAIVDDEDYAWLSQWKWYYTGENGYAGRKNPDARNRIYMHRLIANTPDGMQTDHRNGDKLDNRRANLRVVTVAQNNYNTAGVPNTSSRYKGVSYHDGRYHVRLMVNRRNGYYGRYRDERTAAKVYDFIATLVFGDHARLNFPGESLMDENEFYGYILPKSLWKHLRNPT